MLFNTWEFAAFFALVFVIYHLAGLRIQNVILLVASYTFYAGWDWRFCGLLAVSTLVDFFVGRAMSGAPAGRRRLLLILSLVTNLGILGFFKYFDFFVDSAASVLAGVGLEPNLPVLSIILPVGISFYTFQTLSYTIDVYRRRIEPTQDFLVFAVYVSYFPQLVAGPIERASHLLPQFSAARRVDAQALSSGALLILIGLARKVLIADGVAGHVEDIFSDPSGIPATKLVLGILLFGLQIYGDFAGYTDIARGVSRLLGIDLMVNFNHPYFAQSVTDFWRRWHVSLSTWLRDYLYIPLGGNRGGRWRTYRNLLVTMLLGGLWHGAAWTFVVWGAIHGLALIVHKVWSDWRSGSRAKSSTSLPIDIGWVRYVSSRLLAWGLTFATVSLAWLFFRAPTVESAWEMLSGIAGLRGGLMPSDLNLWAKFVGMTTLLMLIDIPQAIAKDHTVFLRWPWPLRGLFYAALVLLIIVLRPGEQTPFIYFQF